MRKCAFHLSVLLVMLLCPACFEIIEEVNLNNDGSGSFNFTINMSQSKLNINAMLLLDSVNGRRVPKIADIKKALDEMQVTLIGNNTITDIKIAENWDDYIFSFSGNFKTIEDLNKAINSINALFSKQTGHKSTPKEHFAYSQKVFKRLNNYNLVSDYNSLPEKDKMVLKDAKFTAIYRFKTPVESCSNVDALKSKTGTALMLKASIKDLITNKKTIENTVHLN